MKTTLDSFTEDQLAWMEHLTKREFRDLIHKQVTLEKMYTDHVMLHKSTVYQQVKSELEICELWLTQLKSALIIVQERDKVNSN